MNNQSSTSSGVRSFPRLPTVRGWESPSAESATTPGWNQAATAERYASYAARFPFYAETSKLLVEQAGLPAEPDVIDLGCGTGETTAAILAARPAARVIAADASDAMLAQARRRHGARVRYVECRAERLAHSVPTSVDAVLCNSAFWQMPIGETLAAIRQVLRPGGTFTFSVAQSYLPSGDPASADSGVAIFRRAITEVARERFGYTAPAPTPRPSVFERFSPVVAERGFEITACRRDPIVQTAESLRAFWEIPFMMEGVLPGLDPAHYGQLLDAVWSRPPERPRWTSTWVTFTLRRQG